jgi:multiple sugar transport system substrate-binding protein
MKKLLTTLFILAMLLGTVSVLAQGGKSLTIWIPQYQFGDGIPDIDFWNQQFEDFRKENDCEVNIEILPWGDYNTTIYTGLLNNDGPDVVYVTDFYDLVKNDLLLGLDSFMTEEEIDNYLLWELAPKNEEGERCTIPMNDGAVLMFYNKDILEEASIEELPVTWDEFIDACVTIKEKTDKIPFLQNWGATTGTSALMTSFWPYYFQAGGEVVDENGEVAINNEAGLKTLEFLYSFYEKGIFDDTITSETAMQDRFTENVLAFMAVGDSTGINSAKKNNINFGYFFSLKGPAGYGSRTATDSFAVAKKAEERGNAELAVKALKLIVSGKVMDAFHENLYSLPRFTKDSKYVKDAELDAMYTEYNDKMKIVSEFEGKPSFEKELQSNIQLMFMGDLSPQEVLDETFAYYEDQIKQ